MKRYCIVLAGLGFAAGGFVPIQAEERNAWPLIAQQVDASGSITSTAALGPLFFQKALPEGGQMSGFRPLYLERTHAAGHIMSASVLIWISVAKVRCAGGSRTKVPWLQVRAR